MPKGIFKTVISSTIAIGILVGFSSVALAQSPSPLIEDFSGLTQSGAKIENVPKLVVNLLFVLAGFLALGYLMFGGIRWITSRGDKNAVAEARKHIISAIVGIVVVAGSYLILNTVFRLTGAANPLNRNLPCLQDPTGANCPQ